MSTGTDSNHPPLVLAAATAQEIATQVRDTYAATARTVLSGNATSSCCGTSGCCEPATHPSSADEAGSCCSEPVFGAGLYGGTDTTGLPAAALEASLGCGNPLTVADLHPGEIVLDLGSGGGIDVLLSARRVAPGGKAYGLDAVPEMLELSRRNATEAQVSNVEFLEGQIEDIPLPDAAVDVVISNCVINLSVDKPAVFASTFRVLRPGGRFGVSDVVAADHLTPEQRAERGGWVGCIAGALSVAEYRQHLEAAGFTAVEITYTHEVADGMHAAIVRAVKPA
ncbi:arsenite methyltransferase [Catelliglobosispora koreensis]|uniref:arsenite methyltransferase n=1 Tax=Catelliglobosispora koreensis TaxID=129052 RepID=UPI0006878BDD|nr:arsenite methyltransferase [Catelliglobosispora koreensis]